MCRIPEFISGAAKGATSGEVSLQPNMNKPELDDKKRNEDYDH
jgi:hypothetical protein